MSNFSDPFSLQVIAFYKEAGAVDGDQLTTNKLSLMFVAANNGERNRIIKLTGEVPKPYSICLI
jgi:hypothetical protein